MTNRLIFLNGLINCTLVEMNFLSNSNLMSKKSLQNMNDYEIKNLTLVMNLFDSSQPLIFLENPDYANRYNLSIVL